MFIFSLIVRVCNKSNIYFQLIHPVFSPIFVKIIVKQVWRSIDIVNCILPATTFIIGTQYKKSNHCVLLLHDSYSKNKYSRHSKEHLLIIFIFFKMFSIPDRLYL